MISFNHNFLLQKKTFLDKKVMTTRQNKLMIKLPVDDRSGALHQVLSVFAWRANLSKIESRPLKTAQTTLSWMF
jgi:prephenate dehydratase